MTPNTRLIKALNKFTCTPSTSILVIHKITRYLDFRCRFEGAHMKTTSAKTLGQRAKERRMALGLSQPQLARKVGGITYQAIQQLEQGGGTKHLVSIARALGTTAEWLQDGHGPAPSKRLSGRPWEPIKVLGMAECGPD